MGVSKQDGILSEKITPSSLSTKKYIDISNLLKETQIQEVFYQLSKELIGLEGIKSRIQEIAALLLVDKMRDSFGLQSQPPSLHMCFTGQPGTGKTTIATKMATILYKLGYLRKGHLVAVTRDDLVGQYIGHTAPKTKEVLKKAMGGVLFIDEAYYLYKHENERDYGQEAIEILLQVMENQRDDIVVIFAGYKDKMERFFQSNPGVYSRVAHHIDFPNYNENELMQIAKLMLTEQEYTIKQAALSMLKKYLRKQMNDPHFANGRSVRNMLDRARLRHAKRLFEKGGKISKQELTSLEIDDVLFDTYGVT